MQIVLYLSSFILLAVANPFASESNSRNDEEQQLASKLSDSLFTLVKLQPQVKALEKKLDRNSTAIEQQMDYVDLARKFVDSSENTTTLALTFLHQNGLNYTKRAVSAQEVFNIPQKMIVAELMMSMSGDKGQMIEISNDLVTHLNGVRCAVIKRINEVVGKIHGKSPAYPRSMLEFHEMTMFKPVAPVEIATGKPVKAIRIRDECEQAKKKNLSRRLLKYFCGTVSAFNIDRMNRSGEFENIMSRFRRPPTILTLLDTLTPSDLLKVIKKMNPTTYTRTRRASKQLNIFAERHVIVPTIKTENHQFNVTNLIDNPRKMIVLIQTTRSGRFTRYNLEDVDFRGFALSNLCIQDFDFGSKDDFGIKDTGKEERIVKITDFLIMHGWTNVKITLPDTMLPIVEAVKTPHIILDRCMEIDFDDILHVQLAEKKIFGVNANSNVRMWADRRMAPVRFITVMIKSFKEVEEATLEDRVVEMQNFVNHETAELPLLHPCRVVESEYCRWNDIYVKLWSATVEQEGRSASLLYYIVKRKRITLYSRFYPRQQQVTAADIATSLDSYIFEEII